MAEKQGDTKRSMRRFVAVAGGVAATAIAFSFAWGVVGGALRPAHSPVATSIVIAASSHPVPPPPLVPHRKPATPRASVKLTTPDSKQSAIVHRHRRRKPRPLRWRRPPARSSPPSPKPLERVASPRRSSTNSCPATTRGNSPRSIRGGSHESCPHHDRRSA